MISRISEIQSFLQHKDHSLAIRRMLDLALDAGDESLLIRAIHWSRDFRMAQKSNPGEPDSRFFETATYLLQSLQDSNNSFHFQKQKLLQVEDVSKAYSGSRFVLHPISVAVSSGEVIGVVGENGNGKTTLLRTIAGQLANDGGSIQYHSLNKPDDYSIKHHLAFIPQRIPRWYGQLKDNLHFSAAISGIRGRQNEIMVDFMLERMNLTEYAHLTWNRVSSGYRTRFEIARVLLQRPRLMLLDEPLANLDILAQQTILTDLRYMAKSVKHPMGILLSSQQLHEVEKIADTVMFIKQGKCLFQTGEKDAAATSVIEIETTASREKLVEIFNGLGAQIHFNGGFYTITTTNLTPAEMIHTIVSHQLPLSYFRDITHSTKRFF
jgi:ABC-2 type transport system ATP-binding protein